MKTVQKLIIIVSFLLAGATYLNAQDQVLTFGAKAGLNVSQFGGEIRQGGLADINAKIGYNIGGTVDYAFSEKVYLLTGLELTTKGASQVRKNTNISNNAMYINLPLQVGYKLQIDFESPVFVARFGPYIGYGIAGKSTIKDTLEGTETKVNTFSETGFKKIDMGLGASVGLEINEITVDLGYNFGFGDISETKEKIKARNFFLNFGYKFKQKW